MADTELECRKCGYTDEWESIRESTKPADEEQMMKALDNRAYNAKIVCPECGNDTFDRRDDE